MKTYAIGIDLGGSSAKIGFFTTAGELLEKKEVRTIKAEEGKHILPSIAESIRKTLEMSGISMSEVEGVGIGVPGAVTGQSVVNRCVNLGWGVKNVAEELSALLDGIPVKVGNDANVAALGEMWKGSAEGFRNVVMVTLGTGVGGGIILDGKIMEGLGGAGGEIGHICVNRREWDTCGCGKHGHLEQYCSAPGIAKAARRYLRSYKDKTSLRKAPYVSAKIVFDAARNGDAAALEIANRTCEMLGQALAAISCVLAPDIFVIGGGVSRAGAVLIDPVRSCYKKYAFHASENTPIAAAKLGNDAGIYGAVKMLL
ncbi:MAG: ROK family glucokinase [Eubacteriales bacterium]|nr:ROK family glucokinase [Eubacteriales bacterium]